MTAFGRGGGNPAALEQRDKSNPRYRFWTPLFAKGGATIERRSSDALGRGGGNRTRVTGFGDRRPTIERRPYQEHHYLRSIRFNNPTYADPNCFNCNSRWIAWVLDEYAS